MKADGQEVESRVQRHGGNRYGREILLDFSVNTNPLGMPDDIRAALKSALETPSFWEWYPDPDCGRLRQSLSVYHDIAREQIVCGNGASELIFVIVRSVLSEKREEKGARSGLRCLLPVPSFGEYERALLAAGAEIVYDRLKECAHFAPTEELADRITEETALLFLCSPGNPTGALIRPALLWKILERCERTGTYVLLDTCFLELAGEGGGREAFLAAPAAEGGTCTYRQILETYPHLILLKAFTKLYAMPGLRLGYCLCGTAGAAARIREQLPCWNVSATAQYAGLTALDAEKNADYISQSVRMVRGQRKLLESGLIDMGVKTIPGQANFICFYSNKSLYQPLLEKGILIRDCGSFRGMGEGWYRVAVKKQEENEKLLREMGIILKR